MTYQRTARVTLAVFLCLFGPLASRADDEIVCVSYNLNNYFLTDRPKPADSVAAVVDALISLETDILSVSELGGKDALIDLQARLSEKGLDLENAEHIPAADGKGRDLGLLTRYPILERNSQTALSYRIGDDRFLIQRGILDVTLDLPGDYRLRCLGLHLKSKQPVPEGDQNLMRLNEARLVRKYIDDILHTDPETNLLVTGDLNALRNQPAVRTIQGPYGEDTYLKAIRLKDTDGQTWTHFWDDADVYSRFDFALASKALRREVDPDKSRIHHWADWEKASDHRPLVILLEGVDE